MKIEFNGVDVTNDCVVKDDTIIFCGAQWPTESPTSTDTGQGVEEENMEVGKQKSATQILKEHMVKYYRKDFSDTISDNDLYRKVRVFYEEERAIIAAMESYHAQFASPPTGHTEELSREDLVNDFAIDALAVLHKVLHALQHSNMKGTILHQEISAAIKKGMNSPLKIKHGK